jgi:hypothetical protein
MLATSLIAMLLGMPSAQIQWKRVASSSFPLALYTRCRLSDSCEISSFATKSGDWTLVRGLGGSLELLAPFAPNRSRIIRDLPDRIEPQAEGWLWHWTLRSPDSTQCAEVEAFMDEAGLLMHPGSLRRRGCRPGDTLRWLDSWYYQQKREIEQDSVYEVEEGVPAQYHRQRASGEQHNNAPPLVYKPILYLYPTKPTLVRVDLDSSIDLVATHPAPQGRTWNVKAEPDGRLVDLSTSRSHHGLFWESRGWKAPSSDSGLVVSFAQFGAALDSLLELQGLDYRARGEFVTFWIARFHSNPYISIRFENRAYSRAHPVRISPSPDSWLRIFAVFTPLTRPVARIPQNIVPPPASLGFCAVEWGAQVEEP